jgi:hypothetical protein
LQFGENVSSNFFQKNKKSNWGDCFAVCTECPGTFETSYQGAGSISTGTSAATPTPSKNWQFLKEKLLGKKQQNGPML